MRISVRRGSPLLMCFFSHNSKIRYLEAMASRHLWRMIIDGTLPIDPLKFLHANLVKAKVLHSQDTDEEINQILHDAYCHLLVTRGVESGCLLMCGMKSARDLKLHGRGNVRRHAPASDTLVICNTVEPACRLTYYQENLMAALLVSRNRRSIPLNGWKRWGTTTAIEYLAFSYAIYNPHRPILLVANNITGQLLFNGLSCPALQAIFGETLCERAAWPLSSALGSLPLRTTLGAAEFPLRACMMPSPSKSSIW